jgi:glycosyltransferase involved in cell wall biosynthesis
MSSADAVRTSVLILHNRYREAGGEDAVVEAERELLEANGHRVALVTVDNARIPEVSSATRAIRLAAGTVWSPAAVSLVRHAIEHRRPDVLHVHNFLPLLSPAVHRTARASGVAVVQTLHNYRLVCPAGTLFRDGRPCEDCLGRPVAWPAVVHACYRSSRPQSAVVAAMLATHRVLGTWHDKVDLYLAVSGFLRDRIVAGGYPADRILVKGNFVPDPRLLGQSSDANGEAAERSGMLFVGRLSLEKGIDRVVERWGAIPDAPDLRVAGAGPLEPLVREAAARNARIRFVGRLEPQAVRHAMATSDALVFASRWYEGQPMTILEAFAAGLPVIAPRIGSIPELVEDGRTGILFDAEEPGALAEAVMRAMADPVRLRTMGTEARARYERFHTPAANYRQLLDAYERALRHRLSSAA